MCAIYNCECVQDVRNVECCVVDANIRYAVAQEKQQQIASLHSL